MDLHEYLLQVAAQGATIRSLNPTPMGSFSLSSSGLGDTVSAGEILGTSDPLSSAASGVKISINPIPSGLSLDDKMMVMVADLMTWQSKAQVVVVQLEQQAGLVPGASSATDRIVANDRVEGALRDALTGFEKYASMVLPDALAPKVAQQDLALALRRQFNAANVGILGHTPVGAAQLLSSGTTTADDLQRDYLYRLTTFQSIVQFGNAKNISATIGLGFFFLLSPIMFAFAAIAIVAIIAAAVVCTKYITQRNEIWSNVMNECAKKTEQTAFCKQALKDFKEEPSFTLASLLGNTQYLLYAVLGFGALWMIRNRRQ